MNTTRSKVIMLAALFALVSVAANFAQSQNAPSGRKRGFMFEIGAGPTTISYGALADSYFAAAESAGLSRIQVYLNIDLGYAVTQKLYLVVGVDGVGDRFYDTANYVQLNSYLYHAGLRYYPFERGLVLGLEGGAATQVLQSDVGLGGSSPWGWGAGATIAYDFARKPTGFTVELATKVDYLTIESSTVTAVALYLDLLWK